MAAACAVEALRRRSERGFDGNPHRESQGRTDDIGGSAGSNPARLDRCVRRSRRHGVPTIENGRDGGTKLGRELPVDRDERILATVLRPVITDETGPGADNHVAFRAMAEHQNGTDRRLKLIMDGEPLESVIVFQLFPSLRRVICLRVGIDHAGVQERRFHILPATRLGTGIGAFLRDRGGLS